MLQTCARPNLGVEQLEHAFPREGVGDVPHHHCGASLLRACVWGGLYYVWCGTTRRGQHRYSTPERPRQFEIFVFVLLLWGETASKQAQKTTYSCRARQKSQFQIDQHDTSKGPMSPHLNNLRCTTAGHAPQGLDFVLAFGGQGPPPPQVSRPQKNRCRTGVWAQSERSAAQAAVPQNGTPEASHVMPSGKHGRGDASRSRPQDAVASSNRLGLESTISPALGPECLKYRSLGNFCQIWPSPC